MPFDPLWTEYFGGHVEQPPPCNGCFKKLPRNPNLFILCWGFGFALSGFSAAMRARLFLFLSSIACVVKCCNSLHEGWEIPSLYFGSFYRNYVVMKVVLLCPWFWVLVPCVALAITFNLLHRWWNWNVNPAASITGEHEGLFCKVWCSSC